MNRKIPDSSRDASQLCQTQLGFKLRIDTYFAKFHRIFKEN